MKNVALTGHRTLGRDFSPGLLRMKLAELMEAGADTFYCGMALGFDLLCGEILCEMKEGSGIRLIACIPCADQNATFSRAAREQYERVFENAGEHIILHDRYTSGCMFERNRYMVDHSDVVLAYLRTQKGGTFYTVNYAKKTGKPVIII